MNKLAIINITSFGREFPENLEELEARVEVEKMLLPEETTQEELAERLRGFRYVFLGNHPYFGETFFSLNQDVKLIARHGIGYNNVDVKSAALHGVYATTIPHEVENDAVAEQAAALLFAAAKNIITADGKARSGNWNTDRQELVGYQIRDAVTGIIGLGSIGGRFAQIMKYGFNNRVIVYDPYLEDRKIRNMGYEPVSLEELLSQADFVSVHCSLNASTEKLIDAGRLKLMKRDAILINTARGAIVDEMAVYEAVKNREIFAYAADAAAVEPIPADHPLCGIPHVIITPHSAIYNRTCMYQMNRKVMEDLYLMEAGKEPKGIVTE